MFTLLSMRKRVQGTPGVAKGTPGVAKGTPGVAKGTPGVAKGTPGVVKQGTCCHVGHGCCQGDFHFQLP